MSNKKTEPQDTKTNDLTKLQATEPPASAYDIPKLQMGSRFHTLTVVVDNEPGVLARVVGLFSGRGYNIESLTVSSVSLEQHLSRITLVTSGTEMTIAQIKAQLARLIPVHEVHDLTTMGNFIETEIMLVKLLPTADGRTQSILAAEKFTKRQQGTVIKKTKRGLLLQFTGDSKMLSQYLNQLHQWGRVEIARSGVVAMSLDLEGKIQLVKSDE